MILKIWIVLDTLSIVAFEHVFACRVTEIKYGNFLNNFLLRLVDQVLETFISRYWVPVGNIENFWRFDKEARFQHRRYLFWSYMANKQNSSNLLLENIDNEIPIEFELITPSKDVKATTSRTTLWKSSINHLPAENVDKLDNSGRSTKLLENNIAFVKELILKLLILS